MLFFYTPVLIILATVTCCLWTVVLGNIADIQVIDSGNDPVIIYSTAILLKLVIENKARVDHNVSISWEHCCLEIDINDTDCEIMKLSSAPQRLALQPEGQENSTQTATFVYRNLYARYRTGNCTFVITVNEHHFSLLEHTLYFNTTPTVSLRQCASIDQDPDRDCTPVDCAIKYKGKRNFYRPSKGKCEPVVPCNTRGDDGYSVTGYYDWEDNICVQYKWFANDNYFEQVESDTEIPAEIDPSQMKYYPDLEPHLPQDIDSIICNHGQLKDTYCVCDKGWISSGIHRDSPLMFHWCDTPEGVPSAFTAESEGLVSMVSGDSPPRKLNKWQEMAAIISLAIVNSLLFISLLYSLYVIFIPLIERILFGKRTARRRRKRN